MKPTPTPYSSTQHAMAAQFKRQPGRAPIDPLREGSVFRRSSAYDWRAMLQRLGQQLRSDRGPTIGRKRRRRRARGRARRDARALAVFSNPALGVPWE